MCVYYWQSILIFALLTSQVLSADECTNGEQDCSCSSVLQCSWSCGGPSDDGVSRRLLESSCDASSIGCCGNGRTEACNDEECDLGELNGVEGQNCSLSCKKVPVCGDGKVESPEQCDLGANDDENSPCQNCTLPVCGNGKTEYGEDCDDMENNGAPGSDCTSDCKLKAGTKVCGDGKVDQPNDAGNIEECDLGSLNGIEICSSDCTLPVCGDNITQCWEECDHPDRSICNAECKIPECGDGNRDPGEECEPSLTPGCTSQCKLPGSEPFCGDYVINRPDEQCDAGPDGNLYCDENCQVVCVNPPVEGGGVSRRLLGEQASHVRRVLNTNQACLACETCNIDANLNPVAPGTCGCLKDSFCYPAYSTLNECSDFGGTWCPFTNVNPDIAGQKKCVDKVWYTSTTEFTDTTRGDCNNYNCQPQPEACVDKTVNGQPWLSEWNEYCHEWIPANRHGGKDWCGHNEWPYVAGDGGLSANEACCNCGGGEQPPPYVPPNTPADAVDACCDCGGGHQINFCYDPVCGDGYVEDGITGLGSKEKCEPGIDGNDQCYIADDGTCEPICSDRDKIKTEVPGGCVPDAMDPNFRDPGARPISSYDEKKILSYYLVFKWEEDGVTRYHRTHNVSAGSNDVTIEFNDWEMTIHMSCSEFWYQGYSIKGNDPDEEKGHPPIYKVNIWKYENKGSKCKLTTCGDKGPCIDDELQAQALGTAGDLCLSGASSRGSLLVWSTLMGTVALLFHFFD